MSKDKSVGALAWLARNNASVVIGVSSLAFAKNVDTLSSYFTTQADVISKFGVPLK
jgi:hypothetical protein